MALSEYIQRLRAVPASTVALRAERKRISKEVAAWDRMALLRLAHPAELLSPRSLH